MIRLMIGGRNYTACLTDGSLSIYHTGTNRSSFYAELSYLQIPSVLPLAGTEIVVYEDDEKYWGGILVETEQVCHTTTSFTVRLRGQGYEQILTHLCIPAVQYPELDPIFVFEDIILNYVPEAEGLSTEIAEISWKSRAYDFHPGKISSVLDYLVSEVGFYWWVDKDKTVHAASSLADTPSEIVTLDLNGTDSHRIRDLQSLTYRTRTAGYRNTQYAYGNDSHASGVAYDATGISEMAGRGGSGIYADAAQSRLVLTASDGNSIAQQMLYGVAGTGEIKFTTDENRFRLGKIFNVRAPVCGIPSMKAFCVNKIRALWLHDRFRYTVTAAEAPGDRTKTNAATWESLISGKNETEWRN